MSGKPSDNGTNPRPRTEPEDSSAADSGKDRTSEPLVARPRVRSLSKNLVFFLLIGAFLSVGFLSMRFSRGTEKPDAIQRPSGFTVPGVDPDQLERLAERQRQRRAQELRAADGLASPPPPVILAPPAPPLPPPRGRSRSQSRQGIFDVPMSPQSGGRSSREVGSVPDFSKLVPPEISLPQGELDRLEGLAGGDVTREREGFLVRGDAAGALVVKARPSSTRGALQLRRGSFFPVVLSHPINTDVPGLIRGHLARDVLDATGRHLLLPQGTVVVGEQRGSLTSGDSRLLIDWHQAQLPDGSTLDLPEPQGTAAVDGSLGATGKVDRHLGSRFGTALLLGSLGATLQLSQPQQSTTFGQGASAQQIAAGEVGARLNELAERTLEERLNRPPTIRLPAGARLNLLLLNELVFPQPLSTAQPRPGMKSPGYVEAPTEAGF